jgi:hypothetical protein
MLLKAIPYAEKQNFYRVCHFIFEDLSSINTKFFHLSSFLYEHTSSYKFTNLISRIIYPVSPYSSPTFPALH